MRKVYSSDNNILVGHVRQVLEDQGIPCVVRNEFLLGGAGELPPNECWPEIWVADDAHFERARDLVDEVVGRAADAGDWTCPACGEAIEGQFTACWRCGAERGDDA